MESFTRAVSFPTVSGKIVRLRKLSASGVADYASSLHQQAFQDGVEALKHLGLADADAAKYALTTPIPRPTWSDILRSVGSVENQLTLIRTAALETPQGWNTGEDVNSLIDDIPLSDVGLLTLELLDVVIDPTPKAEGTDSPKDGASKTETSDASVLTSLEH